MLRIYTKDREFSYKQPQMEYNKETGDVTIIEEKKKPKRDDSPSHCVYVNDISDRNGKVYAICVDSDGGEPDDEKFIPLNERSRFMK